MVQTEFTNNEAGNTQLYQADNGDITLADNAFISNSDITRDGADLVLTLDNGDSIIVENYFALDTPPTIMSESGNALTPQLVNSFAHNPQFAQSGSMNDVSPVGAAKEVSGEATVTRTDGSVETVTLGTPIYEGDIIETSADGAVNIIFIDETEFAVSEDARLAIDEYVFDPATSEGTTNFSLLRGVFVFTSGVIGRDDPDDVEIETPVGSIGIRGTIIAGKITSDGSDSEITVIEGAIVVRNSVGESILSTQFETVKLSSLNTEMVNVGTLDAVQMNQKFGSVSGVSGSLFSAINDTISDNRSSEPKSNEDVQVNETQQDDGDTSSAQEGQSDSDGNVKTSPPSPATGLESKLGNPDLNSLSPQSGTNAATLNAPGQTPAGQAALTQTTRPPATSPQAENTTTNNNNTLNTQPPPRVIAGGNNDGTGTNTGLGTPGTPAFDAGINLGDNTIFSSIGINLPFLSNGGIGYGIAGLGDIDGDGKADLAFTARDGGVHVFKTTTGNVTRFGLNSIGVYGGDLNNDVTISAGGDIDGNGTIDFIVGTPNNNFFENGDGQITLFNGQNLTQKDYIATDSLMSFGSSGVSEAHAGSDVVLLGDINGDGFSDFAFTADLDDGGQGGFLIGYGANNLINGGTLDTATGFNNISIGGNFLAITIASAGDLNNDGFADIVVGTLNNQFYYMYGDDGGAFNGSDLMASPNVTAGLTEFGREVFGGSDFNRDGHSDLLISSHSAIFGDQVHFVSGTNLTGIATTFYDSRAGWELNGAAMLNDFNGDGIDDIALSTSNGTDSEIFVIYGQEGTMASTMDLSFTLTLGAIPATEGVKFSWQNTSGAIELASVGDVNGDGLDDLAIGAPDSDINGGAADGAIKIVFGTETENVVMDGDTEDGSITANVLNATANGQALLGNDQANIIRGDSFFDISVSAGNGNDTISLRVGSAGASHKTIDGGGGIDKLYLTDSNGTLDFTNTGPAGMSISNIEEIYMNNTQTLILDRANLFELLQESGNNTLKIVSTGAGNTLQIFEDGSNVNFSSLGFTGEGGTDTNTNGYYDLNFGGYTLLVDRDITISL